MMPASVVCQCFLFDVKNRIISFFFFLRLCVLYVFTPDRTDWSKTVSVKDHVKVRESLTKEKLYINSRTGFAVKSI